MLLKRSYVGRKLNVEFSLSPDEPAAQQVVDHITRMIALGVYRPGDDLPSAAALASQLEISRTIIQQAYRTLEERGFPRGIRGGSTTIAQVADSRRHFARKAFSDTIAMLRNIDPPLKRNEL